MDSGGGAGGGGGGRGALVKHPRAGEMLASVGRVYQTSQIAALINLYGNFFNFIN